MSVRMQRICSKQQKYRGGHKTSEESNESPTAGGIYWNNVSACLSLQHFFHLMPLSFLPETKTRRKRPRKKKWYQPWLDHASGITDFHLECKTFEENKLKFACVCSTHSAPLRRLLPVWIRQWGWRGAAVWRTAASETDGLSGQTNTGFYQIIRIVLSIHKLVYLLGLYIIYL